jgi:hypothetical protein
MLDRAFSEARWSIASLTRDCWKLFGRISVVIVDFRLFELFWKMIARVGDSSRQRTDLVRHRQEGTWLSSDVLLYILTPFHA